MARARDTTEVMLDLLADFDGDFNDFEAIDDDDLDLEALLGRRIPDGHFRAIGMHGSGSTIALWRPDLGMAWAEAPAVWLDSEGEPMAPIARSMAELLALLTMYTGTIYDAIKAAQRSRVAGWKRRTAEAIAETAEEHEDHAAYVEAIAALGVEPVVDACATIKAALDAFGTVDAWAARFDEV
jgi:hypothetical protein